VLKPDRGEARVFGLDPTKDGDEIRRRTGVLTENAGLDERLTARENLLFAARIRGLGRAQSDKRVDELLGRFGMMDRADDQVQGFSTGQRKRLALARALLHDPEVLFLDEPTSGLDPAATRDVVELIGSLATEHGRTVVVCTHFLGEAGRLAHRMAVLHRGRLQALGRPDELAAALWDGLEADVDLGAPIDDRTLALIRDVDGVTMASPTADGAHVRVRDREVLAVVVATLVGRKVPVYSAVPRTPTLEDVYFAIEAGFT
jgi:ABC-2 type transport system ATP-binding protein